MKILTAAFLLLVIPGCGTTMLHLGEVVDSQGATNLSQGTEPPRSTGVDPELGAGRGCTENSVAGLNVTLEYELGLRPQVSVVLFNEDYTETLQPGFEELEGWRIQDANGIRHSYVQRLSGANDRSGSFKVQLKVAEQILEERHVVIKMKECHVETQSLSFQVKSTQALVLKAGMEYFPLDSGVVIERDPSTGAARNLSSARQYASLEIIRELMEETSIGEATSIGSRLEKPATAKTMLGRFHEKGIDRGALPAGKVQDTGVRHLYSP